MKASRRYGRRGATQGSTRRSNRGAIRTEYAGNVYASKSEACFAKYLDKLVKVRKVRSWSRQVRVPLLVNDKKICVIVPDFFVTYADGTSEYIEVKGYATPVYKLKLKLFFALYPDAGYRVVPSALALSL